MKHSSLLLFFTWFIFFFSEAQTVPNQFNYQAVARDATGNLLAGKAIKVRITLSDGTNNYEETHSPSTNAYGLFTLAIGGGPGFDKLLWSAGNVTIKIEIDNSGSGYIQIGSTKLLSVPYALYAGNGGSVGNTYTPGRGIVITGTSISNAGDIDSTNDVTKGSVAGGDLTGTYPNPTIKTGAIGIGSFSTASVLKGQIIKFDGTNWVYSDDETFASTAANNYKIDNLTIDTNTLGQLRVKLIDSSHVASIGYEDLPTYNVSKGQTLVFNGTSWIAGDLSGGTSPWLKAGNYVYQNVLSDYVGIGTSAPVSPLDVVGKITADSIHAFSYIRTADVHANFLKAGNIVSLKDITGENFTVNTKLVALDSIVTTNFRMKGGSPGVGKVLTSDINGVASWQASSGGAWTVAGNNIYYSAGNVGIGTANPTKPLSVKGGIIVDQGNINADWYMHKKSGPYLTFGHDSSGEGISSMRVPGRSNYFGLDFFTNFETRMTIKQGGFVGIGTTDPSTLFTVGISASAPLHNVKFEAYKGADRRLLFVDATGLVKDTSFLASTGGWSIGGNNTGAGNFLGTTAADSLIIKTNNVTRMIFSPTGNNVGIAALPDVNYALVVGGLIKTSNITESSDIRYKKNVTTIGEALNKIAQLRGVSYEWRGSEFPELKFPVGKDIGFIAQEVEKVLPELINTDANGYKSIEYSHLSAVLLEAIKEQQKEIESLKTELLKSETRAAQSNKKLETMQSSINNLQAQTTFLLQQIGELNLRSTK